jgi:hypothetical protein
LKKFPNFFKKGFSMRACIQHLGGHKYTPLVRFQKSGQIFLKKFSVRGVYLTLGGSQIYHLVRFKKSDPHVHLGLHCAFLVSSNVLSTTHLVTQHTPADIIQVTMPGTLTSPPPRRSSRSKKSARTSENSKSDADKRTPTSPHPRQEEAT